MESAGTLAKAQWPPTTVVALYPEIEVIVTPVAETCTQKVTITIKGGMVITAISHLGITAKRETIMGSITQRGGPTITVAISTRINTLAPGAAAGTRGDETRGTLDLGLIPAVAPPP